MCISEERRRKKETKCMLPTWMCIIFSGCLVDINYSSHSDLCKSHACRDFANVVKPLATVCRHNGGNYTRHLLSRCRPQPNKLPLWTETKEDCMIKYYQPTPHKPHCKFSKKSQQCQPPLCLSLWGEQSRCSVKTALWQFWHLSQACWKCGVRSHQTPNYQSHTDKPRKCGGRCGCQLIGGITVFAHYHILTVLMKGRTGVNLWWGTCLVAHSLTDCDRM